MPYIESDLCHLHLDGTDCSIVHCLPDLKLPTVHTYCTAHAVCYSIVLPLALVLDLHAATRFVVTPKFF